MLSNLLQILFTHPLHIAEATDEAAEVGVPVLEAVVPVVDARQVQRTVLGWADGTRYTVHGTVRFAVRSGCLPREVDLVLIRIDRRLTWESGREGKTRK